MRPSLLGQFIFQAVVAAAAWAPTENAKTGGSNGASLGCATNERICQRGDAPRVPQLDGDVQFHGVRQRCGLAIVLLGEPGRAHGTGFVISRKHRLAVTAAHVADQMMRGRYKMQAVADDTGVIHPVERIFYHPAIVRWLGEGLHARSDDPKDGEVANSVPDVAVVQLSASGPDLSAELQLADEDELQGLTGQPVGILGYPVTMADSSVPTKVRARAALAISRIDRTTNFFNDPGAPPDRCQGVWCDANDVGPGSSGSPLFLRNGNVVGILCRGITTPFETGGAFGGTAFRADCIRELLAYHGLADTSSQDFEKARSHPKWGTDPRLGSYRKAISLIHDADRLRRSGAYRQAGEKCNEALKQVPNCPGALLQRSKVYLYYVGTHWNDLTLEARHRYADWAFDDSHRCVELFPEWNEPWLIHSQNVIYYAASSPFDASTFRDAIKGVEEMLGDDWAYGQLTKSERAFAYNLRAQCHQFLGEIEAAEKDYDASISLSPHEPRWYSNRAQYWEYRGRKDLAERDHQMAHSARQTRVAP